MESKAGFFSWLISRAHNRRKLSVAKIIACEWTNGGNVDHMKTTYLRKSLEPHNLQKSLGTCSNFVCLR